MIPPFIFLLLIFAGGGWLLAGLTGALYALLPAAAAILSAHFLGAQWIVKQLRGFPLEETLAPEIHALTRELCEESKMKVPALYLMPSASANLAAVAGPERSALVFTRGLFENLNSEEFEAVIGWGLARIHQPAAASEKMAAVVSGSLIRMWEGLNWLLALGSRSFETRGSFSERLTGWMILPLAALIVRASSAAANIARADARSAGMTGDPLYLASALSRMDAVSAQFPLRGADPAAAHLFALSPLPGRGMSRLFRVHPPVERRMAELERAAAAV